MYYDTICIKIKNYGLDNLNFDYNFFITKNNPDAIKIFSPIKWMDLLYKFKSIGFDTSKYFEIDGIFDDSIVYCSYNWMSDFDIFFNAYPKIIHKKDFNLTFRYGNFINNIFILNNIIDAAEIIFTSLTNSIFKYEYHILEKVLYKTHETYQIVDYNGDVISTLMVSDDVYFENYFFKNYFFKQDSVKQILRKHKLENIKKYFNI